MAATSQTKANNTQEKTTKSVYLKMDLKLHKMLRLAAISNDETMNEYVVRVLKKDLKYKEEA